METHICAAAKAKAEEDSQAQAQPEDIDGHVDTNAQEYRNELVQWMTGTDLADNRNELKDARDACRTEVTVLSLARAVHQAADVNKEALGQRAIATLTRVCAVAETYSAKAAAARALGSLATHSGLAAWMLEAGAGAEAVGAGAGEVEGNSLNTAGATGGSTACLAALARVVDIRTSRQSEATDGDDAEKEVVAAAAPDDQDGAPEEAWIFGAKALGVLARQHPHAVASTPGVVESLTAMCKEDIAETYRDESMEAGATALQPLMSIGRHIAWANYARKKAKKAAAGATELGQWTKQMGMDAVVAGLVNVCTAAAGTARAKAAAATALANLLSPDDSLLEYGHRCAVVICGSPGVIEACVKLCKAASGEAAGADGSEGGSSEEEVVCMEAGARLLWHLAHHDNYEVDTAWVQRIDKMADKAALLSALVHICATATADSALGAAASALNCCTDVKGVNYSVQTLGTDAAAIRAIVRCCRLSSPGVGMGGAAGVLCALARNGHHAMIRDTEGAADALRKVCERGPTEGVMFAARALARLTQP